MRVIIAGSLPPESIRSNPQRMEQWYEEHYETFEGALERSGMYELVDSVAVLGPIDIGWGQLAKRWASLNGLEFVEDIGNNSIAATLDWADGMVAFWNGKSQSTRRFIVWAEQAAKAGGMELECIWVELVEQ